MPHCFTPIRGRRLRVTKVNSLGRPVYGTNSFVVTGGFVSVQFSPQIQEGEEITVRTADGSLCVSERGCDELQWIEVQIEFCQVDPCLFTLINETWTELRDCTGEVIGWAESYKFSCDSGFALELWTDVTGYTPTTPGATSAYGYMLLPFIVGGTLGEQTVENGAISFTITGRTKKGSGWDVGPYDVMCNDAVTGACGPLLTPVGPDEPRRIMLTTCPPPAAACGCQPLSSPDGPAFTLAEGVVPDGQPRRRVQVTLPAGLPGTYKLSWGDNTPVVDIAPGATLTHDYLRDGTYNVSVWDTANNQKISVQSVTVPFAGATIPVFTVTETGADTPPRTATVTVNNAMAGRTYQVQWIAGGEWVDLTGTPPTGTNVYTAAQDGQVVITVRDKVDTTKSTQQTITIPFPVQPELLVTEEGGDATRRTTRVTVTNPQAGATYEISWDGGATYTPMPTTGTPPNSSVFQMTGGPSMQVIVRQVGLPTNLTQQTVTLPWVGPEFTIAEDADNMTARVTVLNPIAAAVYAVAWTDGTWTNLTDASTPPYSGTHTYTAGTYEVQVRNNATPTVIAVQQVTIPFSGAFLLASTDGDDAPPDTTSRKRGK